MKTRSTYRYDAKEMTLATLRERGAVNDALLGHIAPLSWNHIGLTGDYNWHANKRVAKGGSRPPRRVRSPTLQGISCARVEVSSNHQRKQERQG
jgi:hypothetical protein